MLPPPYQIASTVIALLGIAIAFYFYKVNRHASEIVGANLRPLVNFLYNKWYIDEIYNAILLRPLWILGHILSIFDRYVIDGLVFLVGFIPQVAGYSLKPSASAGFCSAMPWAWSPVSRPSCWECSISSTVTREPESHA